MSLLNRTLSPQAIANGAQQTDGLLHGTPRTAVDEARFHRGDDIPADAFGPNAPAVWAVIERLTWFTWDDSQRLLRAEVKAQREHPLDRWSTHPYDIVRAARAAGEIRLADWRALREIVTRIRCMVRPARCGIASGVYGHDAARWDDAFAVAQQAAQALLVADRPELSADVRDRLTAPWTAAFGDAASPTQMELTASGSAR